MKNSFTKIALFTFLIGLVIRLMFLNSNVFFFDGDEAILGVMASDLLKGNPSLYFYGQTYGFSFIEVLMISLGIKVFGTSMLAIKIPMLLFWLSAVTLVGLTIWEITKKNIFLTFLSISIIILSPTWLVWSMKARGGYMTSFFCSTLILYILVHYKHKIKLLQWLLIGGVLTIMWESQPLFVVPTLPIVIYGLFLSSDFKVIKFIKSSIAFVLGAVIVWALFYYIKLDLVNTWDTPATNFLGRLTKISELPDVLINNLGGNYFLSNTYSPNNEGYSKIFLVSFAFSVILVLYNFLKERKIDLRLMLVISSFASLFGFFVKSEPRYLLPFFLYALLTMILVNVNQKGNLGRFKSSLLVLIMLVGVYHLPNFKNYSFVNMKIIGVDKTMDDKKIMENLVTLLKKENIKYVYSTNEFLQYQLNYMTNNEIITISRIDRCRTPWNISKVQNAYKENKSQFAVIGYNFNYANSGKIPVLNSKIFYILRPHPKVLEQVGFFNKFEE